MEKCFKYLADNVFTGKTAPVVKGRPVFYHFGGGATPEEFTQVLNANKDFVEKTNPVMLRRWADWGKLENDIYKPVTYSQKMEEWKKLGEVPTAWIPARVRERNAGHLGCDFWASKEDVLHFMEPFRDQVWLSDNPAYTVKCGFVIPGMDNHGCGGWGHSKFYEIDRYNGKLYDAMWQYNMQYRDSLDMMFIASWSDYTEGHEIEPTIENGYRELETTLRYASVFKEFEPNLSALRLPQQLFQMRKAVELLQKIGLKEDLILQLLDNAALQMAEGSYKQAADLLIQASEMIGQENEKVINNEFVLTTSALQVKGGESTKACWDATEGFSVTLPTQASVNLSAMYSLGTIEFWYLDKGTETLFVRSTTKREPKSYFANVGKIATCDTGEWKHARIELYGENIVYSFGKPTFFFKGNVMIRDISMKFNCFSIQ